MQSEILEVLEKRDEIYEYINKCRESNIKLLNSEINKKMLKSNCWILQRELCSLLKDKFGVEMPSVCRGLSKLREKNEVDFIKIKSDKNKEFKKILNKINREDLLCRTHQFTACTFLYKVGK